MPRSQLRTPAAPPRAPGLTPRKARTAKQAKAEHRGGEWGHGVAKRLRQLKGTVGVNRWSVDVLGFSSGSKVSAYLSGKRLPDAATLRTIAERTGVSLDWLLLGDGSDAPCYRGQSRDRAELEADVAAYIARALDAAAPRVRDGIDAPRDLMIWRVDGAGILKTTAERVCEEIREGDRRSELVGLLFQLHRFARAEQERPGSVVWPPTAAADPAELARICNTLPQPSEEALLAYVTAELNVSRYPELASAQASLEAAPWRAIGDP
jgi:transcriptional regulator with XRE-family HTH domain